MVLGRLLCAHGAVQPVPSGLCQLTLLALGWQLRGRLGVGIAGTLNIRTSAQC